MGGSPGSMPRNLREAPPFAGEAAEGVDGTVSAVDLEPRRLARGLSKESRHSASHSGSCA